MSTEVRLSTRDPAPEKIQARHCDRHAVVYVRQSTLRQVEQNRESTRLQYGLADRACRLGWRRDQVVVIDDDLGRSGASTSDRPGFQRLVAEVGLGHVGLVLGIEVSRLARSCRDWHQLLEMCALFDTLIGDADGIYDPGTYNDRLLLGLKGTMSEAELHILKSRMHEGRRAKAQRGELVLGLPRGYVLKPSGEIALDPDEGVRQVIGLVFAVFERRRSVSGLLRYLVDHDIQLPDRVRAGPDKGEVRWKSGRIEARTGLRMMPTFPRSPRSFRTAGFPQYGWKAGLSGGAFPDRQRLKPAPGMRLLTAGLPSPFVHRSIKAVAPYCAGPLTMMMHRLGGWVALRPRGPRSGPGYAVPVRRCLTGPIRPTRRHIATSPQGGLYAMPSLCGSAEATREWFRAFATIPS